MSFILDALRKSELERQRDSAPGLMRSPVATIRRETPVWSWLLIVLLSLALVALAATWWLRDSQGGAEPTVEAAALPAPADAVATTAAPATTATTAAATPAAVPDAAADDDGAIAAAIAAEPKSMADLVRAHPELPRYALSFLEYNGVDPANGSARINGERYYPGQVIAGGPELVGIRPDGAVLLYRGQTYLLTTR
jgi:general secretion pathway protein B